MKGFNFSESKFTRFYHIHIKISTTATVYIKRNRMFTWERSLRGLARVNILS
jgi:hypothetical protein